MSGQGGSVAGGRTAREIATSPAITMGEFDEVRKHLGSIPDDLRREWVLRSIQPKDEAFRWYRLLCDPEEFERELVGLSRSFNETAAPYRDAAMKLLRRFLIGRIAFHAAREVGRMVVGESWIWLVKDFLLIRIGLSLVIGYGTLLGAGSAWGGIKILAGSTNHAFAAVVAGELAVVGALIYLSIRDRIGGLNQRTLLRRTGGVLGGCAIWCAAGVGFQRWIVWEIGGCQARLAANILAASTALLIAVISQFFFGRNAISEPL